MSRMIFVNLPSTDLARSDRFYSALGWRRNPAFSDDSAVCMVWSETIHAMLLTVERWRTFCERDIPDAHHSAQVMLALNLEDRAAVDSLAGIAGVSGGSSDPNPPQDHGFMVSRSVADPDGHIWELFWMDPASVPQTPDA